MRVVWFVFGALLTAILIGYRLRQPITAPLAEVAAPAAPRIIAVVERRPAPNPPAPRADSIVRFALRQLGTNYCYAGTSPDTGFDCSGFVQYVFTRFGVAVPHATALLIGTGRPVPRAQAQPGDIVVFTGTAPGSTTPGHAGIVISAVGEVPLRFVHSSSAKKESGVKVSQVEGSGYEGRFMQVRRVI
jgi:cell wall-associated NlpC family hydrolase